MAYNTYFEISSFIFLLIIAAYTWLYYGLKERTHRKFFMLIAITLLGNALDVVTAYTIEFHEVVPIWINSILNIAYFIVDATISSHFVFYFEEIIYGKKKRSIFHKLVFAVVALYSVVVAMSPFTKWVFYFNEEGYGKGPVYFLVFVIPLILVMVAFIMLARHGKVIGRVRLFACVVYLIISLAGPIIQIFLLPDVLLSVFGASVGLVLIAFSMEYGEYEKAVEDNEKLVAAKQEAERLREEAEQTNSEKDKYIARLSHEIRTPINAILGMNEMIQRESKDDAILPYTQDVESSGKMLLSLVNDILDLSKIEAGMMEIIPAEYKLKNLLRDCYVMVSSRAREKGIEFEFQVEPELYNEFYGDEIRIRQILVNLLTNAVKYTDTGRVTLHASGRENDEAFLLTIAVKDTGRGIKPEAQKVLFDAFQRIDEKKDRRTEGTGLGLNITKHLINMMGGTLSVESVYELGSSFTVSIPQVVMSEEPIGEVDFSKKQGGPKIERESLIEAPNANILVVDDVKTNLKVMTGLLKQSKVKVDTALSGAECLKMAAEKRYNMIFLDHMMPEMDGLETMYELKNMESSKNKETPVIMLTANAVRGAKEQYMEHGFAGYLTKPCKGVELEEMMSRFLPDNVVEVRRTQY
ncbi:MAG: response regulator [Lachnospiraceae bacterium]|nr:response regulator [Candidatus Merdinaster equi]